LEYSISPDREGAFGSRTQMCNEENFEEIVICRPRRESLLRKKSLKCGINVQKENFLVSVLPANAPKGLTMCHGDCTVYTKEKQTNA
jgi:hypothetical protein